MNMKKYFEQGMMSLLERKNLDAITVGEIIEEVGSCKGTFYKHYLDKYGLCCCCFERHVYSMINKDAASWEEFIMQCLSAFENNTKAILHAFNSKDVNSPRRYHENLTSDYLVRQYVKNGGDASEGVNMITLKLYAVAVTEIIYNWLNGGCKESRQEIYGIICAVIPQAVFKQISVSAA